MGSGQQSWVDRGLQTVSQTADQAMDGIGSFVGGLSDSMGDAVTGPHVPLLDGMGRLADHGNQFVADRMAAAEGSGGPAPSDPWSDDFLRSRLDWTYQSGTGEDLAGSDQLTELMNTMAAPEPTDPAERAAWDERCRNAALQLNTIRENPKSPELAMSEYNRFRLLQEQAREAVGNDPDKVAPALDQEDHPDHMGSIQQLRYGSYVGEMLDVDPVYGALLNPTGGLVGAGNDSIAAPADSYGSFHGEAHDAFGYLSTYHDVGPGYMYATPTESAAFKDTDVAAPLTGQHSGFEKWHQIFQDQGYDQMSHQGVQEEMDLSLSGIVNDNVERAIGIDPGISMGEWLPDIGSTVETVEDWTHMGGGAVDWLTGGGD